MEGSVGKLFTGVGALVMGQLVGSASEWASEKLQQHKSDVGMDMSKIGLFDFVLDLAVQVTVLTVGTSFVEKAMPSVTNDLHSLMFYILGIAMTQKRLSGNMAAMRGKLSSYPREAAQISKRASAGDSPMV
jgi:hypothetical protein